MKERDRRELLTERIELVVQVTPCLLGFAVSTYNVRVLEDEGVPYFTQGQGFIRERGIFTSSELIRHLIHTEEPFQVRLR